MRLIDWLRVTSICGLDVVVWISGDEEFGPYWEGPARDIPYWVAEGKIETDKRKLDWMEPIDYRSDLGEEYGHKPGFVIILKDN